MAPHARHLTLSDQSRTERFAALLGAMLSPGDTLLLRGEIGAGKTAFARALIRSLQDDPEDVPSPTFTLVQVYDTRRGEVWHADLYRIASTAEIEELGLTDAFADAICLIEWPDRLGELAPRDALTLTLGAPDTEGDTRQADLAWSDPRWTGRVDRAAAALEKVGVE